MAVNAAAELSTSVHQQPFGKLNAAQQQLAIKDVFFHGDFKHLLQDWPLRAVEELAEAVYRQLILQSKPYTNPSQSSAPESREERETQTHEETKSESET